MILRHCILIVRRNRANRRRFDILKRGECDVCTSLVPNANQFVVSAVTLGRGRIQDSVIRAQSGWLRSRNIVGAADGANEGPMLGRELGKLLGELLGKTLGRKLGTMLGKELGEWKGDALGEVLGE
jgi:hypothetical protein